MTDPPAAQLLRVAMTLYSKHVSTCWFLYRFSRNLRRVQRAMVQIAIP